MIEEWARRQDSLLDPRATLHIQPASVRAIPEVGHPYKTSFQVDIERIFLSRAFRRLKHKSQLILTPQNEIFRTRLTHSLEVAQTARTICNVMRLNADLAEAIALVHDIGHPPFGHAGQDALDEFLAQFDRKFHHHQQGLRTVDHRGESAIRTPDRPDEEQWVEGLNLCRQVRDGLRAGPNGENAVPVTLEGQVVDWADTFSYINHDYADLQYGRLLDMDTRDAVISLGKTGRERTARMIGDLVHASEEGPSIQVSSELRERCQTIRAKMTTNVYRSGEWLRREDEAKRILTSLLNYWNSEDEHSLVQEGHLSKDTVERFNSEGDKLQVLTDFAAAMTETYALEQYQRIFSPEFGVGRADYRF